MNIKAFLTRFWPYLFLIAICIFLTPRTLQNDTFYLIKIGDFIWNQGIDFQDHFSWVAQFSYLYPHFLFNLLCYFFYALFNFEGLYLLAIILYIFFAFSLFYILKSLLFEPKTKGVLPFLLTLLSVILLSSSITARSQALTYSLFLWEVYFLERLLFSSVSPKKYLILLTVDSWLIAMTHAITWPLFFVLFLPFLAELLLLKFLKPSALYRRRRLLSSLSNKFTLADLTPNFKLLALAFLLAFLAGLFTPSRVCFFAFLKIMQAHSQSYIAEHRPLTLLYALEALVPLLLFLVPLIFTKAKLAARWFFLFLGLTVLSFLSVRHVSLLISLGFLPLALLLNNLFSLVNPLFLEGIARFTPRRLLLFTVFVLSGLNFADQQLNHPLLAPPIAPVAATDFILENYAEEIKTGSFRLWNEYNIGAYLLFRDIPVSIDSRANIYTKPFSDFPRDIFDDYQVIMDAGSTSDFAQIAPYPADGPQDYESLIAYYAPTHFLLYKKTSLAKVFLKDPNYQLLYSDDDYLLFAPVSQ